MTSHATFPEPRQIESLFSPQDVPTDLTFSDLTHGYRAMIAGEELALETEYDPALIQRIKGIGGAHWDPASKRWLVRVSRFNVRALVCFLRLEGFTFPKAVVDLLRRTWADTGYASE